MRKGYVENSTSSTTKGVLSRISKVPPSCLSQRSTFLCPPPSPLLVALFFQPFRREDASREISLVISGVEPRYFFFFSRHVLCVLKDPGQTEAPDVRSSLKGGSIEEGCLISSGWVSNSFRWRRILISGIEPICLVLDQSYHFRINAYVSKSRINDTWRLSLQKLS